MNYFSIFASAFLAVPVLTGSSPLAAQSGGTASVQPKTVHAAPEPLDKKGLAAKLVSFQADIAEKMIPTKVEKQGARRIARWLKKFQVVQGKHYLVFTNGPKTSSQRFAASLEELYESVRKTWPFDEVGHHHRAYIFASKEEYWDFCVRVRGWSRVQATRSAGHACAAYYAAYYQSPKSEVVMHEATHQIVHANLKIQGVGSWFQEGMAVYAAGQVVGKKISGGMRSDLRNGKYYPFPEFVKIPSLIADEFSRRNYKHSGCLIEFLMETKDPALSGKFPKFLDAAASRRFGFGRGEASTTALFQEIYGLSLKEVDTAFLAFHRVKPRG